MHIIHLQYWSSSRRSSRFPSTNYDFISPCWFIDNIASSPNKLNIICISPPIYSSSSSSPGTITHSFRKCSSGVSYFSSSYIWMFDGDTFWRAKQLCRCRVYGHHQYRVCHTRVPFSFTNCAPVFQSGLGCVFVWSRHGAMEVEGRRSQRLLHATGLGRL